MNFLKNFFQLQNKVIIITGCNGQLGSSLVDIFLELGSIVIGIDNVKKLRVKNKNFYFYSCDISRQLKVQSLFVKLFLKFKNIYFC